MGITKWINCTTNGQKMIEMIDYMFAAKQMSRPRYTLNKVTPKQYEKTGIVCEQ
jgi:hypothetical protein